MSRTRLVGGGADEPAVPASHPARLVATLAVALMAPGTASADVVPLQGTQEMHASVAVYVAGVGTVDTDSFAVSAPDPLGSWLPPVQNIAATYEFTSSRVSASYASELTPETISLVTSANVRSEGNMSLIDFRAGSFDYTQTFNMQFSITEPGIYRVAARIERFDQTGWSEQGPATIAFGRDGEPLLFSLRIDASNHRPLTDLIVEYPETILTLDSGTYTVAASDANSWPGGHNYIAQSSMSFTLTAGFCRCDWDQSGTITSSDFFAFLIDFFAGDADFNRSGTTDDQDFYDFLTCFFGACP